VSARHVIWKAIATVAIACTALASVGFTAPADSLFTISIRPVLVNLAVDVDIKVGTWHLHERWSVLPDASN
jgi:hypothetical protein